MAQDTQDLLKACDLRVSQNNPRSFTGQINTLPQVEVWFQRSVDIVRQVREGVIDLAIAGIDMVSEYQGSNDDIIIIHDGLGLTPASLQVIVPQAWKDITHLDDLIKMVQARPADNPIRVVSSFKRLTTQFLDNHGITPYHYLYASGGVEASPQMGTADFIVDIVQTGLTLRENHLKMLDGGQILQSQGCLFGNRAALKRNAELLTITRQILERFEAHLRAKAQYSVIANIRGESANAVAERLHTFPNLCGLQGPTIAPVYPQNPGQNDWYAISIMVKKPNLQTAIQQLRSIGGSGVVVLPVLFIFDETPERWQTLQEALGR